MLPLGDSMLRDTIYVGKSLLTKLKTALAESAKHVEQFKMFNEGLDADTIQAFEKMVLAWDVDHKQPNPYAVTSSCKLPHSRY
jgi:hypothetical protein